MRVDVPQNPDVTVDGPDIHKMFEYLYEILDKSKRITGIKLKERNKEGWYYTKPDDNAKSFD